MHGMIVSSFVPLLFLLGKEQTLISAASRGCQGVPPFGYKAGSEKVYFRGNLALMLRKTSGTFFLSNYLLNNHDFVSFETLHYFYR